MVPFSCRSELLLATPLHIPNAAHVQHRTSQNASGFQLPIEVSTMPRLGRRYLLQHKLKSLRYKEHRGVFATLIVFFSGIRHQRDTIIMEDI